MKNILLILLGLLIGSAAAQAETFTTATVSVTTAQDDADEMARTGRFRHRGCHGSRSEGIGYGSTPEQAKRNCCYWGRRTPVEIGIAQCHRGRGWYAVVRYR